MKHAIPALRLLLFMTLLTGVAYPFAVTGIALAAFRAQASGSRLERGGATVGSELLAQKFASERYFWPRPSAIDYNTLSSGGSNLGQASAALKKAYDERRAALAAAHPGAGDPPQELLFASGSGLDPHIRPSSAEYQVARVAKARGLEPSAVRALAIEAREGRQLGVFGEPRVNVLKLNLALDRAQGILGAPKLAPPPAAAPGSTPGGMGGS